MKNLSKSETRLLKMAVIIILLLVALFLFNGIKVEENSVSAHTDPYSTPGKRIENHEYLEDMTMFPEHDLQNGCGMVAMGVLLQFYRELDVYKDGRYLPDDFYYKKATERDGDTKQSRANALRDDLTQRTPKFLGTVGSWVGMKNATVHTGHVVGLNSYFNAYYPNHNVTAYKSGFFPSESSITNLLDRDIPVLLTLVNYFNYDINDVQLNDGLKEKQHVVVAYGYKYVGGKIRYLCHMGWGVENPSSASTYAKCWVSATDVSSQAFVYGYCYISAPTSRFCVDSLGTVTDIIYTVPNDVLNIPYRVDGTVVRKIEKRAFYKNNNIVEVYLPSGLIEIDDEAFRECRSLTKVYLNSGLKIIGDSAFLLCENLSDISLPGSLTYIGSMAFCVTNLSYVSIPSGITEIEYSAFSRANLKNITFSSNLEIIGDVAFFGNPDLVTVYLPSSVTTLGSLAFAFCDNLEYIALHDNISSVDGAPFIYSPNLTLYISKEVSTPVSMTDWIDAGNPVIKNCTMSANYVVSFIKTSQNPAVVTNINNPRRSGYTFNGWYTASDFSGTRYMDIATAPDGTLYARWSSDSSSCVTEGTLITLADGSKITVENLTGNESLLVWNLFTGAFDTAPILFIDSDPAKLYEVINLTFSDGTTVRVIDEHGFWNLTLNEYVFLRKDAARYIGHYFSKQTTDADGNLSRTAVSLVNVELTVEQTAAYSPVTFGHLCYYVNGMLSMPGATTGLVNIFAIDPGTMRIDETAFLEDIAEYGLFTYEEFSAVYPVPEIIFEAFNGQYLKTAMGKGLLTEETLSKLIERYSVFFGTEEEPIADDNDNGNNGRHGHGNKDGRRGNNDNRRGNNGNRRGRGHDNNGEGRG